MAPSELRHETGTQKPSMTTVTATALVATSNACVFQAIGTARSRRSRTAEKTLTSVAVATMPASKLNAMRRKALLNSGLPGKNANAQAKAPAVETAIMPVSLLLPSTVDRRMTAATRDVSARQIRIRV